MNPSSTLAAVLTLALLSSCRPGDSAGDAATFDFDSARAIIESHAQRFTEAHITGDLELLDNIFTEDARVYAPGSDVLAGKTKISEINARYVEYGVSAFQEVSKARYGGPDIIVDEGTYTMTYGSESTSEAGHYVNVWKRVNGDWKLFANMWTTLPVEKGGD